MKHTELCTPNFSTTQGACQHVHPKFPAGQSSPSLCAAKDVYFDKPRTTIFSLRDLGTTAESPEPQFLHL